MDKPIITADMVEELGWSEAILQLAQAIEDMCLRDGCDPVNVVKDLRNLAE